MGGNMKEKSAVELLVSEIRKLAHNDKHHLGMGDVRITQGMLDELEEQAKEMEKKQICNAWENGYDELDRVGRISLNYYKETYEAKED